MFHGLIILSSSFSAPIPLLPLRLIMSFLCSPAWAGEQAANLPYLLQTTPQYGGGSRRLKSRPRNGYRLPNEYSFMGGIRFVRDRPRTKHALPVRLYVPVGLPGTYSDDRFEHYRMIRLAIYLPALPNSMGIGAGSSALFERAANSLTSYESTNTRMND
jgi:hypothetical protein